MPEIMINKMGVILEGDDRGWYVFIENESTSGYSILVTPPNRKYGLQGYDHWVEGYDDLKKYFESSNWKIKWLSLESNENNKNAFYDKHFILSQLLLIVSQINFFKVGNFRLFVLINRINSLIEGLNDVGFKWQKKFYEYLKELEILYAISLDKKKEFFDIKDIEKITEIIKQLEIIIYGELEKIEHAYIERV